METKEESIVDRKICVWNLVGCTNIATIQADLVSVSDANDFFGTPIRVYCPNCYLHLAFKGRDILYDQFTQKAYFVILDNLVNGEGGSGNESTGTDTAVHREG